MPGIASKNVSTLAKCLRFEDYAEIAVTALRLHPVVPTNQRWSKAATTLPCGRELGKRSPFAIPQGSNVYIAVYTMHRRKDIYGADADVFRPERWEELHPGWGFVPFGGGPRLCIGRKYTHTVARTTIPDDPSSP